MVCPHCGASLPADATSPGALDDVATESALTTRIFGEPANGSFAAAGRGETATAGADAFVDWGNVAPPIPIDATDGDTRTAMGTAAGGRTGAPERGARAPDGPLEPGQSFSPRYQIIKLLGLGGMGAVYKAWDAELSVSVALKVIRPEMGQGTASAELEKRFKNELLLARQVTHKSVVRIHDLGEIAGIKYITMPYVDGDDLATVLRVAGKLPIPRAMRLARQMASGLEAAHDAGVVHRDLKPANIMIGGEGDNLHALIMDFGISVSTAEKISGGVTGTLEYMAPEQATTGPVDGRADIYAFGLILYEMLIGGRPPRPGPPLDRLTVMKLRFVEGLPAIRSRDASIPEGLAEVVTRCLERDPGARYQTSSELVAALAALDDEGEPIPVAPRFGKGLIAASVLCVALAVAGTWWLTRTPPPPKQHDPVSVVIADFRNGTGDPAFNGTLEPTLRLALEDSGFITAYDRAQISRTGAKAPPSLPESAAREIAVRQGLGVVLAGSLNPQGSGYAVAITAAEAVTGKVIAAVNGRAAARDQVLGVATTLVARIRKALGDDTSDTAQRFAKDSLTTTSLEVVREYAAAMEAMSDSRFDDARRRYARAVELDPKFGFAYAGMAMALFNRGQQQEAEKYAREAVRHLDGMTDRERIRTRGNFYLVTSDYANCVKEYGDLLAKYPADVAAHNNLALCSTQLRNIPRALEEMRRVVTILPKRALYRVNMATYAAYASDPATAQEEAGIAGQLGSPWGLQPLAFAQHATGQLADAAATYASMGRSDDMGASYTASGLGDMAVFEGRYNEAARILEAGIAADLASKEPDRAAAKLAALGYAELSRGRMAAAAAAADRALSNSRTVKIRFLSARLLAEAGQSAKARPIAATLASELLTEPQAYAKIVEGDIALRGGDARGAVKALTEATALLDTWIGRFDLGRAYIAAGAFTQADSEIDRCIKRRGEALSLFLDEEPTYAYFPVVYYHQGRIREGLKSAGAADSYRTYIELRAKAGEDPLLALARARIKR
jgi:eukaryotic-like serine/threonine-protein kinase